MAKFFLESFEITLSDIRAVAAEATNAIKTNSVKRISMI